GGGHGCRRASRGDREPSDGAPPRVDGYGPAAPRGRPGGSPGRHVPGRLDHGRSQGACHGDHPRARALATRAVHRRVRLPRSARRPRARPRHPDGDRDRRHGTLPRGRRDRGRLGSRARARRGLAQDRRAPPSARRGAASRPRAVLVWLNGRLVPAGRARVSALDRGLLHGDGAYDTWRTYAGRPLAVAAHVRRLAAARRRADEALYVTPQGQVTEGTTTNLFLVERGALVTPPRSAGILPGVTRALVLALARREGVAAREESVPVPRLRRAAEVFLTSSTVEIVPVVRLDGRVVGDGRPGELTRLLQVRYAAHVRRALRVAGTR